MGDRNRLKGLIADDEGVVPGRLANVVNEQDAREVVGEARDGRDAPEMATRVRGAELTARELEVLRLIAGGKSNHAIADTLFIAEATVKTHVNNILAKLNAEDRTVAAAVGLRRGLINLEYTDHGAEI
jgi:DNA-binding NarL/FixJ family response regulator